MFEFYSHIVLSPSSIANFSDDAFVGLVDLLETVGDQTQFLEIANLEANQTASFSYFEPNHNCSPFTERNVLKHFEIVRNEHQF